MTEEHSPVCVSKSTFFFCQTTVGCALIVLEFCPLIPESRFTKILASLVMGRETDRNG